MENDCSLIIFSSNGPNEFPSISEIETDLKSNDIFKKQNALKKAIIGICNGEDYDRLLMIVISYCAHCQDHLVLKLSCLYTIY